MSVAERGMGIGLRALGRLAGLDVVDRLGVRQPAQRILYRATRDGFRAAGAAGRTFKTVQRRGQPVRLKPASDSGVFDLTPSDEQQMIQETFKAFALEQLRPAALKADDACAAPKELLDQVAELGLPMLGVPEELGGAVSERSTVTSVLAAEALAEGDMGLAAAALAPASVASALSLWGDASQQATYLPALIGEDAPAAALALQEPQPLFDPFKLKTIAKRDGDGFLLSGAKALVPRAAEASLLIVSAEIEGEGPALFLVETANGGVLANDEESKNGGVRTNGDGAANESKPMSDGVRANGSKSANGSKRPSGGVRVKTSPAMGVRAAALGMVSLEEVRLPGSALLGGGDPTVYADCVRRARLAWCALSIGAAKAVLDYVTRYVNERIAFGEPISHRQSVAFAVSNIAIELEGMRLAVLRAASRADAGKPIAEEVSIARTLCVQRGVGIGSDGVQLLGGHGYVKEHPVERWYRDLQAAGVFEGALLV